MPRMPLHIASGSGRYIAFAKKTIRFVKYGCTNRPFFHIVVMHTKAGQKDSPIEQLGTYDPIPNFNNEKLVSFNYERIQHWIGMGAHISKPAAILLGLAGFLPLHPTTYAKAWQERRKIQENISESVKNTKVADVL